MYKCGASKVKITPEDSLIPRLYGLMCKKFAGVIDDLYVRVLAIGNDKDLALIISEELDKSLCADIIIPRLAEMFEIPKTNILYFGVHTHTAPLHGDRPFEGPNGRARKTPDEQAASLEYERFVTGKVIEAAKEAVGNMVPARIGYGVGESYIGENRVQDYWIESEGGLRKMVGLGSNPKGACDPSLFVLKAETTDGKPIAFFINHAVHCCVMIMNNYDGKGGLGIGPDIAGNVSRQIETKYPGAVALWSSGAAGDINPRMMNQFYYADEVTGEIREYNDVKSDETARLMMLLLSHRQSADVIQVVRKIKCGMEDGGISGAEELISCEGVHNPYEVNFRAVKVGNIAFVGASGELYGSHGRTVQKMGSDAGAEYTVVINHESSLLYDSGYVFDDETLLRCRQEDGSISGKLPDMWDVNMKIGAFTPALKEGIRKIFDRLGE